METKTESETPVETAKETGTQVEANTKRTSTKEIIAYLAEKFPACFSIEGAAKPLKIGIFQDLAEQLTDDETVSKTRLRQALRHYTSSWRYLKAIRLGAFRVDINGEQAAEIDQEQADYAAKTLKESQEKFGNKNYKDNGGKKPYKGKKPEITGAQQKSNDKNKVKDKAKFKAVKSNNRAQSKVAVKLKPVESNAVTVGKAVKVQLGNSPIDAVITEVSGNEVSVQLNSGMVVKTQVKNIFTE
ncbi:MULTISPECIES: RNA chaperone ProQ [Thalassotalea]|uniref:RNA chaperone ProQ n=1 Tax=Thalassotalea castellviae TaxID=3075612 RepID=A0ABU2ZVZ7_9GAMM|nr:RNA chaperone ProQ [Thalassotalea sp. W431]MDT0602112.1 RNA chaperone ProQ [Thalassotalea sp. W431]